jgi:hypothetical protein
MEMFVNVAPYLKDPLVLIGFVIFLAFLTARQLLSSGIIRPLPNTSGFRILRLTLGYGFVLGLLVVAIGGYLKYLELSTTTPAKVADAVHSETKDIPREVDYGFVELVPGQPVAVPSHKFGKPMVLYGGEDFEFHAIANGPIPVIELRAGDRTYRLPGSEGRVKIVGPLDQALPAFLRTSQFLSPSDAGPSSNGFPSTIAVKIQVLGVARPK